MIPALVVPAVAATATTVSGSGSASSAATRAGPSRRSVGGLHHQGLHGEQPEGVADRGVRLVADRHSRRPRSGPRTPLLASDLPGDGQRRKVAGTAPGNEAATGGSRQTGQE